MVSKAIYEHTFSVETKIEDDIIDKETREIEEKKSTDKYDVV